MDTGLSTIQDSSGSGEATEYADGQAQCAEKIRNDSVQGVKLGI